MSKLPFGLIALRAASGVWVVRGDASITLQRRVGTRDAPDNDNDTLREVRPTIVSGLALEA